MFCGTCGGENSDNAKFCYYCGKKVRRDNEEKENDHNQIHKHYLMPALLRTNAFHILGLDTVSDSKIIQKQGKEIINHLEINDLPEYNLDIDPAKEFRNKESVKLALQNLSSPKTSLKEFFFWFDIDNNENKQQFVEAIKVLDSETIIKYVNQEVDHNNKPNLIKIKNVAIYFCILLYTGNNKTKLKSSLDLWSELINSNNFWQLFFETYKSKLGYEINNEIIMEFQKRSVSFLSDLYTEISQKNNDPDYVLEFQKRFDTKGEKIEKDILIPTFKTIQDAIDELNAQNITKKSSANNQEVQQIYYSISKIQNEINKLTSLGLSDDSRIKIIRDQAAKSIRDLGIKINNEWNDQKISIDLIKKAKEISSTLSFNTSLDYDIKQLEELKTNNLILKSLDEFIDKEQFIEALLYIERNEKYADNQRLQESLRERKKACVTGLADKKYNNAMSDFKSENFSNSKSNFENVSSLIYNNLSLFNFNKKTIDELLDEIPQRINYVISNRTFSSLDNFRNDIIKTAKQYFEGYHEEDILIMLVDSHVYLGLINSGIYSKSPTSISGNPKPITSAPTLYTINGVGTTLYGDTQYFVFIFLPIIPLARFSVEQLDNKSYRFYGKLEMHPWQKIWQYMFVAILGFFIINYWILVILAFWFILLKIQNKSIL